MVAFCALGWASLASAMTIPCLWLPGIGSMFRAQDPAAEPVLVAQEVEKEDKRPAQPLGPQPTFVPTFPPQPQFIVPLQQFPMSMPMTPH